jgi:xanthine dehydrogenase accessory factor
MIDFFERVAALRREGHAFAIATVVGRRAPVSAHLGDHAIVFADGRMEGFVGGACAHEIVRQQARESIAARHGRLVSIRPDAGGSIATAEHVVVPMTCTSEGAVDVYIDPLVQAPSLIVVGATPVADALARLARGMDYDVVRIVDAGERRDVEPGSASLGISVLSLENLASAVRDGAPDRAAVVASQGHYDEQALEVLLRAGVPYVGLVASHKRGATVRSQLEETGVPGVAALRSPAGLDLGARTAPEVAVSILAEMFRSTRVRHEQAPAPASTAATSAVDPVCGMNVELASARHKAEVDGVSHYFCCANCRAKFLKDPRYTWLTHDRRCGHPQSLPRARVHRRRSVRHRAADHAGAREAVAHRGPGRRRQDRERESARRRARMELIRLQCYEGPDAMAALYEWNYPRQMLHARLSEAEESSLEERSLTCSASGSFSSGRCSTRLRASGHRCCSSTKWTAPTKHSRRFSSRCWRSGEVTIPELGTIRARHKPHVILTSNRTRELSDALRRRCLFLWLPYPSLPQEIEILHARVPGLSDRLARQIAQLMQVLRGLPLQKAPGVAESLDWALALMSMHRDHLDAHTLEERWDAC